MASNLSYLASKKQLKWNGSKEQLINLLSSILNVSSDDFRVNDNGSCAVIKCKDITCNYYVKTGTLQVQGKGQETLKEQLADLALESQQLAETEQIDLSKEDLSRQEQDGGDPPKDCEVDNTTLSEPDTISHADTFSYSMANSFNAELVWIKQEINHLKSMFNCPPTQCTKCTQEIASAERFQLENERLRQNLLQQQEKYKELEEERDSLKMVVKILSKDLYKTGTVESTSQTASAAPQPDCLIVNRSEPEAQVPTIPQQQQSLQSPHKDKRKSCIILGDSIIQHIQGFKLSKELGQHVVVKSFSGATTSDMHSYVQPTLDKYSSSDTICLHIGTNDLKSSTPTEVCDSIVDLAEKVQSFTSAEIILSELITRKDSYKNAASEVNRHLKQVCKERQPN